MTSSTSVDNSQPPRGDKVGSISICGTPITEYNIVIPKECDLYTKYAAQNLKDYLHANANIDLDLVTDEQEAAAHEIVIGNTNRQGSTIASQTQLDSDEYVIMLHENSVVIYAESYMIGAGAGELVNNYAKKAWLGYDVDITDIPKKPKALEFAFKKANNAILLIGDGMGFNHIDFAFMTEDGSFSAEDMPNAGEIITQSQSVINKEEAYTDSAAAGTALATGYKTLNTYLGIDPNGKKLVSLRKLANSVGAKTAILSTDHITGATPSAFLVYSNNRWDTAFVQKQIDRVIENGSVDYAIGSIGDDLVDQAASVLHRISANGSTFFTMIEEGYIDKNAHVHNYAGVKHTVKRFDGLVAYCMEFIMFHPDTVLIVTADHETGALTKQPSGKYLFTFDNHTNFNVPIFAIGDGTEIFDGVATDNTRVAHFIGKIFGDDNFGDQNIK